MKLALNYPKTQFESALIQPIHLYYSISVTYQSFLQITQTVEFLIRQTMTRIGQRTNALHPLPTVHGDRILQQTATFP